MEKFWWHFKSNAAKIFASRNFRFLEPLLRRLSLFSATTWRLRSSPSFPPMPATLSLEQMPCELILIFCILSQRKLTLVTWGLGFWHRSWSGRRRECKRGQSPSLEGGYLPCHQDFFVTISIMTKTIKIVMMLTMAAVKMIIILSPHVWLDVDEDKETPSRDKGDHQHEF